MAHSSQTSDAPVTRRAVFYIPGYDPIHPRRYRELYRKEGAAQAQISGYELSLSARQGGARYGWDVKGLVDGVHVDASVDVLVWSDIVRGSMETSIPATYWQLLRTAWVYIGSGALWRLMQLRKGPVIAALYPVGMLLAQLFTALLLAWLIVRWGGALALPVLGIASYLVAGMLALAAFLALMRWFKAKDAKFFAYYLMHD
jgi:hypothetical protein